MSKLAKKPAAQVAERRPARSVVGDRVHGVVIATVISTPVDGQVRIAPSGMSASRSIVARLATGQGPIEKGREVAVVFEGGDSERAIVIGLLERFPGSAAKGHEPAVEAPITARLDGEIVILEATKEIVLRCGEATITLTRAGKILIQGAYVSSRSSGVNRIRGGAVQIN